MNFRDTIGYEGEAIPDAATAPAVTHSIMQVVKATMARVSGLATALNASGLATQQQVSAAWWGLQTNVSGLATQAQVSAARWGLEVNVSGLATLTNVSAVVAASDTAMKTFISAAVRGTELGLSGVIGASDTAMKTFVSGAALGNELAISGLVGAGVRLLTELSGGSTTLIAATGIREGAGWWKQAAILGVTGHNIGVMRPIVTNTSGGTITVNPALRETNAANDTYLLISAHKAQVPELQPDVPVTINAIAASETNVFDLSTAGYSYILKSLWLKFTDPGADTITVRLYQLINDVLTEIDSFTVNTTNFGTYFSLVDLFGENGLAGDNLKVTVQSSSGTYAVTGQYSYSTIYTGTG